MREAIEEYAAILAKGTGEVPAVDVAWKLRQILADPNAGVPDAEVTTGAPVSRRDWESRDQSPWTLFKRDMSRLNEAVIALTRPTEETDRG